MTLHNAGHKRNEISSMLSLSYRKVSYIITRGTLASVPRPKGKHKLTQAQVDELEAFVRLSRKNRQMSYLELVYEFRFWNAGVYAITSALKDRGYYIHLSLAKPPLSEANKRMRFEWVSERLHWTSWTKLGKELLGCSGGASLEDKRTLSVLGKELGVNNCAKVLRAHSSSSCSVH